MRVIVYSGYGTTTTCFQLLEAALRNELPTDIYTVELWDAKALLTNVSWTQDCKLICFGGGFDEGMVKSLGEKGMTLIREYIKQGGRYMGICAGAYFACKEISFDANGPLQVKGARKIALFEGKGVGPVYPGFQYDSELSARVTKIKKSLKIDEDIMSLFPNSLTVYYNGGCTFITDKNNRQCKVLYNYADKVDCGSIIYCQLGAGAGILCGVHPEFDPQLLSELTSDPNDLEYLQQNVIPQLTKDQSSRVSLIRAMLTLLDVTPLNEN